ncbi:hypothetical protein [Hyphomonas sp.]|uniref:hypothetical protein n=1 Tax=Hyphomonas sp. TaxID=87 RepID=UPI000C8B58FF|nr:hypothetical protein [Hyphomonas sp.]MAL46703.1 hypothetical protein [Hyphomonas sp.]
MAQDRKRGDIVASPRSRLEKEKKDKPIKTGADAQQEFTDAIEKLFSTINAQLEVEPNVNTIIDRLNKKDKKKLN